MRALLKTTATYPWIVWPSRRSLWSLRVHQVPSTAIPGPAGLFNYQFLVEEGAWLSEDIYVLAQGLLPSRGLSSNLPEPLPRELTHY